MDRDRCKVDSGYRYKVFFEEIYDQTARHEIESQQLYNMDEKGFLLGRIGKSKRTSIK
jgi:hypothetical protein